MKPAPHRRSRRRSWRSSRETPRCRSLIAGEIGLSATSSLRHTVKRSCHRAHQPALPLGHQPGCERPVAVPGHGQGHRSGFGLNRLRRAAIAGVGQLPARWVTLLITQVIGQLGGQPALEGKLDQPGQQTTSPVIATSPESIEASNWSTAPEARNASATSTVEAAGNFTSKSLSDVTS